MEHTILINNIDIYSKYGMQLALNAYNEILALPAMKPPQSVIWEEEDGTDYDLTSPVLAATEFSILFIASDISKISTFVQFLFSSVYLYYKIDDIDISRQFRCLSVERDGCMLTIHLSDDASYPILPLPPGEVFPLPEFPAGFSIFKDPANTMIDGISLSKFNICPLLGTAEILEQSITTAQKIITESVYSSGRLYGTNNNLPQPPITFSSKNVTISFIVKSPKSMLSSLWWGKFLRLLMLPGEHELSFQDSTYIFKYNSCKIEEISIDMWNIFFIFALDLEILR